MITPKEALITQLHELDDEILSLNDGTRDKTDMINNFRCYTQMALSSLE